MPTPHTPTNTCSVIPFVTQRLAFLYDLAIHPTETFRRLRPIPVRTVLVSYLGALGFYTLMVLILAYTGLAVTIPPSWVDLLLGEPLLYPSSIFFPLFIILVVGICLGTVMFQTVLLELTISLVFRTELSRGTDQSVKAIAASHLVWLAVGWIPIVGTIATIPTIIYQVIGIRELHSISTKQAIVARLFVPAFLAIATLTLAGLTGIAIIVWG